MTAYIQNRQGQWEESTRNLEHAIELNPRNLDLRVSIAMHYTSLRRYADLKSALAGTLAVFSERLGHADMAGVRGNFRKKLIPGRCIKCSTQFEPQIPLGRGISLSGGSLAHWPSAMPLQQKTL